jgi:hypothetical protein
MKKLILSFCLMAAVLMVVACAATPAAAPAPAAPAASRDPNLPEWLDDFPPEDAIWGIGTAKQSSESMSMTTAENRARVAVARQLNQKVQNMFTDYNLDAGNAGKQANSSLQEEVSRLLTNADLSGARPVKRWKAPDGTWWYLVEYKKSDAKKTVAGILVNEEAAYAQFKSQQALQMMDAQFAKNEKPLQVDN